MRKHHRWIVAAMLAAPIAVLLLSVAGPAHAIPAWTRRYGVDCSSCHVAGFKLTKMGQNFLRSGHTMESDKEANLSDHVSVAQKSRYNWSKAKNEDGTGKKVVNSFEEHALSLYMGGPLEKEWSYFAELYWHENSGNTSGSSDLNDFGRSKLADAYLQYIHHQGEESFTSVRFGQFSPYLLHLNGVGARLDQDRPVVINSGTVGDNPYKPFSRQYGLEVAHYVNGFYAAAALVNGTGGKLYNRVDNDLKKDAYATLDYTLDDNGSLLGVYGYTGHYPLAVDNSFKYEPNSYDEFRQLGVMGNYTVKQGALIGALYSGQNKYVLRRDFAAPVDTAGTTVEPKSLGYYVELQLYSLHPRVQPYLRWDFWDANTDVDSNEISGPMLGLSWRALDNGRLVGQYTQLKTKSATAGKELTENKVTIEANFMF